MKPDREPEIIDVEFEVLEGECEGPVIDAEPVVENRPPEAPRPGPGVGAGAPEGILGDLAGRLAGEVLGRRPGLAKFVTVGVGLWGLKRAYDAEQRRKKKRRKRMKRIRRSL